MKKLIFAFMLLAAAACSKDGGPYLLLSAEAEKFPQTGGSSSVTVTSNSEYSVQLTDNWVTVQKAATVGNETTWAIEVSRNPSEESRETEILFTVSGYKSKALRITQDGTGAQGVYPTSFELQATATSASFKVSAKNGWKATSDNETFVVNPSSGTGDTTVVVTFPENTGDKTIVTTISVAIDDVPTPATVTITQKKKGLTGIIADWSIRDLTSQANALFALANTQETGTSGRYLPASTGNGKIEFYNSDKSGWIGYTGSYVCARTVGSKGDIIVAATVPGDYWLISATYDKVIPAGSTIRVYFVARPNQESPRYWIAEYKDGESWKPVGETATTTETATASLAGTPIEPYSAEVTYNYTASMGTDGNGWYKAFDGRFTTGTATQDVLIRFRPAGYVSAKNGKYINALTNNVGMRFSAQTPNTEGGVPVKTYTEHVLIEFPE